MTNDKTRTAERRVRAGLVGALLLLLAGGGAAQEETGLQLESIDVTPLVGDRLVLELRLNGPAPEPLSFTIDNPARISLDLPGAALAMSSRRQVVREGPLESILTAEAQGRTRVVLNMDTMVPYETRREGNSIIVMIGDPEGAGARPTFAAAEPSEPAPMAAPAAPTVRAVRDIDFRRGDDGAGRVVVRLTDPSTTVDVRDEAGRVVVDFRDADLPDNLLRRLDVLDFATPVTTIDSVRVGGAARLVIAATGTYEHFAYQAEEIFTVEFRPVEEKAVSEGDVFDEGKEYVGQRLTLNFQDIETRSVLQLLADTSGLNIVVSDTVQGNVTLRLQNVPWDQALDIVLKTKGLDMRQVGNVVLVAPATEIAARERQELESRQEIQRLAPLRSDLIQVNYAKAADLAALLESGEDDSLLSARGSVTIDDRTNTLLVSDTADRLGRIRRLVETLDIPVKQVLIESRIVVVNDDFSRDLGVRFGVTYVRDDDDGLISTTGTSDGSGVIVDSAIDNANSTGSVSPVDAPGIEDRYNVNLPVSDPAGQIALAILDSDYIVDLELSAAQAEGRGEVISTPRVVTANQREALIEQGTDIPYQESSSSGATTTQFKKAVLSLRVTPQITPDDRIILDLQVNQDTVGDNVFSATGGLVPSIDTRSVVTQVLVNDGETVVLGGIFETEVREDINKVPVLGDLPGVGRLFKTTSNVSNKSELLIFVTPRILREGATTF